MSTVTDGGRVRAVIPVTPRERLVIYVGGDASGATAGFNGGGSGAPGGYITEHGYGGGGASDVREHGDRLWDRIVIAGGGGGDGGEPSSYGCKSTGGKGAGLIGGSGKGGASNSQCGGGGTPGTNCFFGYDGSAGDTLLVSSVPNLP